MYIISVNQPLENQDAILRRSSVKSVGDACDGEQIVRGLLVAGSEPAHKIWELENAMRNAPAHGPERQRGISQIRV